MKKKKKKKKKKTKTKTRKQPRRPRTVVMKCPPKLSASPRAAEFCFPLYAVANERGEVMLEVFTLGGVTEEGGALEANPEVNAFWSKEEAERVAAMLGPNVWPMRALLPMSKKVRWTKI